MKARIVGPWLLILLGLCAILAPATDSLSAGGTTVPCGQIGVIQCPTTTTTMASSTTTSATTDTTAPSTPTTALPATSMAPTSAAAVLPSNSVGTKELARTGSRVGPMTFAGIFLVVAGAALLMLARRRRLADSAS